MKKIVSLILILCTVLTPLCFTGVSAEHIDAEFEDGSIHLWFDYASEKISDSVGADGDTGMESFTAYMAKNEIEDIQFVLASDSDKEGLSAEVSSFCDKDGNTLDAEIFIELYHDCGSFGSIPDAIPPLSAYGNFSLTAGKSQAFLIKLTSTAETAAGDYEAIVTIKDSDGRAVKCAAVYAHVWDFALSDETACATSINLDYGYLSNNAYGTGGVDANTLYRNYYDYLLENRVCAYYIPAKFSDRDLVGEYLDNPRVTAFQGDTDYFGTNHSADASFMKRFYRVYSGDNAARFDKAYHFSNVVDASRPEHLEALRSYYDKIYPNLAPIAPESAEVPFRFITTYINDIDYTKEDGTVIDQIEYYKDFVNLWCSKPFAYTDATELSVRGAKVLQPLKWDSVYGTFKERMSEMKERGDKVWWFLSWDVEAPYINYYMQTDGVAQRILFWQQYDNGVEGFLYNFANFWMGDCRDPYKNNVTNSAYPNGHGESILIYPGAKYGLNIPVGSLRLEAMRDGIEDYQMFYMLDGLCGDQTVSELIDRMTTGMVTYSISDKDYYETRIEIGNAIEEKSGDAPCEHVFVDGICTICGEADPNYVSGDIDGDGYLSSDDAITLLNRILLEPESVSDVHDYTCDGVIDSDDAVYLLYHFLLPDLYGLYKTK